MYQVVARLSLRHKDEWVEDWMDWMGLPPTWTVSYIQLAIHKYIPRKLSTGLEGFKVGEGGQKKETGPSVTRQLTRMPAAWERSQGQNTHVYIHINMYLQ